MTPHGYLLKGNSKTAAPAFIPSLIGVEPAQANPHASDPYFERVELTSRRVNDLAKSRWVTYDSLPLTTRDPILAVRSPVGNYYIPASELYEIAAFHHDDDTIALLERLRVQPQ